MQQQIKQDRVTLITPTAPVSVAAHGGRAKCLQRLIRLAMPVPVTVALSFDAVRDAALGNLPDMAALMVPFGAQPLLSVRPSSESADWGGPSAILNVGMNDARFASMSQAMGEAAAARRRRRRNLQRRWRIA